MKLKYLRTLMKDSTDRRWFETQRSDVSAAQILNLRTDDSARLTSTSCLSQYDHQHQSENTTTKLDPSSICLCV